MRGKPARTVAEVQLYRHVIDYLLTSKAGLSRRDIHGETSRGYHVERRTDITATIRRVCASLGRPTVAATCGAPFTFVGVTTLLAGLESVGVFSLIVASWILSLAYYCLPDWVFDDPDPKATVTKSSTPGMSGEDVYRYLAIHTERQNLKEEKIEKQRKRQERRSNMQSR